MSPTRMLLFARRRPAHAVLLLLTLASLNVHPVAALPAPPVADATHATAATSTTPPKPGPNLLPASITWAADPADAAIVPGSPWTGAYSVRPVWSYPYEFVDSFFLNGPTDWSISSISPAPAENVGEGLKVGQARQNPRTGNNTSDRAHAYWGFDPQRAALNYVNLPAIKPPTRSFNDGLTGVGVYVAAGAPGGPPLTFGVTYAVPTSWDRYLCPGALAPHQFVGLSGLATDPNFLQATLYSSGGSGGAIDVTHTLLVACRQPAVTTTMAGTITGLTGSAGTEGTATVSYCFTTVNASADVHLAAYTLTGDSIGYLETRDTPLAPGASDTVCAPDYTYSVTWPPSGEYCVTNESGVTVTAVTPSGWRERVAGDPAGGFADGVFTATAVAGAGQVTCAAPTAVTLSAFSVIGVTGGAELSWETVSEPDNLGFNIYRADRSDGPAPGLNDAGWKRLNAALVPAATPGSVNGHRYTWLDSAAAPERGYWYVLETVAVSGTAARHGPVGKAAGEPNAAHLTRFAARSAGSLAGAIVLVIVVAGVAWLFLRRPR